MSEMTAVFHHKCGSGLEFDMCIRCQLFVDADGDPDPKMYTYERYVQLMKMPRERRCKHQRLLTMPAALGAPYEFPTTIVLGDNANLPTIFDGRLYRFQMSRTKLEKFLEGFDQRGLERPTHGSYTVSGHVNFRLKLSIKHKFSLGA